MTLLRMRQMPVSLNIQAQTRNRPETALAMGVPEFS